MPSTCGVPINSAPGGVDKSHVEIKDDWREMEGADIHGLIRQKNIGTR